LVRPLSSQGIGGTVTLRGSAPQIGQFRIRIVDHPEVSHLKAGLYPDEFEHLTGKTAYFGQRIPDGEVWRIKGELFVI
jgi:mannosyl-oligosaccharide glucosidase